MAACGVVILKNVVRPAHAKKMRNDAVQRLQKHIEQDLVPLDLYSRDSKDCDQRNMSQRSKVCLRRLIGNPTILPRRFGTLMACAFA